MQHLEEEYHWLGSPPAWVSLKHEGDKVVVFERAGLLFVFNFHSTNSFADYRVGVDVAGEYKIVLSSDDKQYGGFENVDVNAKFVTTPLEWNGRKNWLHVRGFSQALILTPHCFVSGLRSFQNKHSPREGQRMNMTVVMMDRSPDRGRVM
jgi:1,4-alpha-glucan branching enzyme